MTFAIGIMGAKVKLVMKMNHTDAIYEICEAVKNVCTTANDKFHLVALTYMHV